MFPVVLTLMAALGPVAARADGTFQQFDYADRGSSYTGLVRQGRVSVTLGWSEFATGSATSLWASYGIPVGDAWLRIGPSFRRDNAGNTDAGLRLALERYAASDRGWTFALAEFNTIQREYLVLGEVGRAASRLSVALVIQGNRFGFREQSVALGYRPWDAPVTLRVGYRTREGRIFIGLAINAL